MKLSELLAAYGDDALAFQKLDDCATSFSMTKHGTTATFVTPETFGPKGFYRLGLVVWLDRHRVDEILAAAKKPVAPAGEEG